MTFSGAREFYVDKFWCAELAITLRFLCCAFVRCVLYLLLVCNVCVWCWCWCVTLIFSFNASLRLCVQDAHRVYIQTSPLCTGTTPACVTTCGRGDCTRGDVLNLHTEVYQRGTPHTGHTPQTPHALPHTTSHTTSHGDRQRETEKEDREREMDEKDTTRWKRREDKTNFSFFLIFYFFFSAPKKEVAKLAPGVCSRNSEQARGEPKKPTNSVVVAKTLDVSQAREEVTPLNLQTKCRYPQIVLGIARNSLLRRVGKEDIPMLCRMSGSKVVPTLGICSHWKGRVDGTIDSARYRFGCLCHYDYVGSFICSDFSSFIVRGRGIFLWVD